MKSRSLLFGTTLCLALSFALPNSSNAQVADYKQIPIPALHEFHPQVPVRVQLANGMVILLMEDHELPLVQGTAFVRGGSVEDPAAKTGLNDVLAEVWRTGGTKEKTGDQLDDYLEARAAKVETGSGQAMTTISWNCLKGNLDDVFAIYVQLLRQPEFREDKIPLAKRQLETAIARRNDDPFNIAFREAARIVYGKDNPYSRIPEYATVAAITRQDLVDWHKKHVFPNNIVLGISGDFSAKEMEAKLRAAFESWPKGPDAPKPQINFTHPKAGVYYVEKSDVTASTVQMVDLGILRSDPDFYATEVFNNFFGEGFSSRLFTNIRSKKGLAYAVGGGISANLSRPGITRLFMGTKLSTTAAAIDAFNEEVDGLKKNPCTPEELKKAKDVLLNAFVFRFDSPDKILQERMVYEFYGYPANLLEKYRAGIEAVTLADVNRIADKYMKKEKFAIVVVGKASEFDRPLSTFGPVTSIDVTIPPPPGGTK